MNWHLLQKKHTVNCGNVYNIQFILKVGDYSVVPVCTVVIVSLSEPNELC